MKRAHVCLIPGFFGFANFGRVRYFAHVVEHIQRTLREHEVEAKVHQVPTLPTSSITTRTVKLLETLEETVGGDDHPIHLIGHSTGGLDIRLLLSTGLSLPTEIEPERYVARVRSAVSVACPHRGTPLAGFFTSVLGQRLLKLLSATTMRSIRLGVVPTPALALLAEALFHSSSLIRLRVGVLDRAINAVLESFEQDRRDRIVEFLSWIEEDQALLVQLAPESMDLFNARVSGRDDVRCGCVVTRARRPGLHRMLALGIDPRAQAAYAVFRALHRLTSEMPAAYLPRLERDQERALRRAYGDLPGPQSNDAIVPTLSQVWCDVIHATWADHLDAIGHFDDPSHDPPHADWLHTASGFRHRQFEGLWDDVARFALGGA